MSKNKDIEAVNNVVEEETDNTDSILKIPPKPDKEGALANQKALLNEIKALEKSRDELKNVISNALDTKGASKEEVDAKVAEMNALKNKRAKLNEESGLAKAAVDKATKDILDAIEKGKNMRASLKSNNSSDIDNKIRALELKQSTTSMTLTEEKNLLKEITALQQSKTFAAELDIIDKDIKSLKVIKDVKLKDYDIKIKSLKAVTAEQMGKSKELDIVMKTKKKMWNIGEQIREKKKKIDKDWKAFEVALKEWQKYQKLEKSRKDKEYKKLKAAEQEKQKKEAEERRKREEEEELKKPPYDEEQKLCDTLIKKLKALLPPKDDNDDNKTLSSSSANGNGDSTIDGMTVLNRELENFMVVGGGTSNKKKKGKKTKTVIPYDIEMIENFKLLDLVAPVNVSDLMDSIEALDKKKSTFANTERGSIPSLRDKRLILEKKLVEKSNKTQKKKSNDSSGGGDGDGDTANGNDKGSKNKKSNDNVEVAAIKDKEKKTKSSSKSVFSMEDDFPALA